MHTLEEVRIPAELLEQMYVTALQLEHSDNVVLHYWGLHLMRDWMGLRLLAEKYG